MLLYITPFHPINISFIGNKTHFNGIYHTTFWEKGTMLRQKITQKIEMQAGFPLDTPKNQSPK